MAKGRKLSSSRSERFLGSFGGQAAASSASELREEDIWSVADDAVNGDDRYANGDWGSRASADSSRSFGGYRGRRPSQRSDHNQVGGLSLAFDEPSSTASQRIIHQFRPQEGVAGSPRGRNMATSAPVNVPDWSKIYRVDSVESLHDSDDGLDDAELVPPHEYLAREYARSRNSVFEGVGRTLKGRDMSRVRDAVWSQTGFDG
ncbi:protein S40-5-like [Salvia miltiorrhiza]|uniref:protein S40-5-like n=1 Tax=Salvia miltiorrhiza TaxID=226208 RepID=UPI0025AC4A71|nr:protein S40-5-like [Salvia miltiorrhiza]